MKLLGFGTYDEKSHPRVKVLLDGLAQRGNDVREANEPLETHTSGRVDALKSPAAAAHFAGDLVTKWGRLVRDSRRFRGENRPDAVVVGYMGHFDVLLARALFGRTPVVLDHLIFASNTASDRGLVGQGLGGRAKKLALSALDSAALHAASVVIVDTPEHLELLSPRLKSKAVVVPVGAPDEWFDAARPADMERVPGEPLSVVFFGLFTPLQGAPTIAKALAELEKRGVDPRVTLVGDGQDAQEVRGLLPNGSHVAIEWRDWVDAHELPALVAGHDVCLGIFGTSDKALRVVPNKAYQGVAAGCALVTSDTPPQRAILGNAAIYVPAGDPAALADTLEELTRPGVVEAAWQRSFGARKEFRPAAVVAQLEDVL